MNKYVVDASAWIEYLKGSELGGKVKKYIESQESEVFTSILTLAEIISVVKRHHDDTDIAHKHILALSKFSDINEELCIEAGLFHATMRATVKDFGLADAFIFATAKRLKARIITKDTHFKGFKEAIMIQ